MEYYAYRKILHGGISIEGLGIMSDNTTNKLQKLVWKFRKSRHLAEGNSLSKNSLPYFYNFLLTSLKVTIMYIDKLPFWFIKFAVLNTTISHPIFLFKNEVNSYWKFS